MTQAPSVEDSPGAGPRLRVTAALVGAQKCGTTTLASVLGGHRSICLAEGKEAHLFDQPDVQATGPTEDQIDACFASRRHGQLLLDATPSYLYLPGCVEALVRHAPEVRLVVVLRSPADRAVSHYGHERRLGAERMPLPAALFLERRRLRGDRDPLAARSAHRHWSYLDRGRYVPQLERVRQLTTNLHVVLFDELVADPDRVVGGVTDFLGVEPLGTVALPHLNPGDRRYHRVGRAVARGMLRRDTAATETALGLASGALR